MPGVEITGLSGETAPAFARAFSFLAGDVTLVVDDSGVILGAASGDAAVREGLAQAWQGRTWIDAVTTDSREKVAAMLQELAGQGRARRREMNFLANGGPPLALACSALRLGEHGPSLVIGRDLYVTAMLQQRLLETQQQLERSYWDARRRMAKGDLA